jgi:hypothetical protein
MFGLLNPFLLWLAPLLAAPLIIHFLGRAEPKVRDFPSLLPVRGQLARAMQRHRLKNWLQLLLRTLVLLCLLLAAGGLVWRSPSRWTPPESTALLVHNGAYGAIPSVREAQSRLRRGLDSLAPGRGTAALVIPDAPPGRTAARFGRYPEAVSRLLRQTDATDPSAASHVFLPVFDTRDLDGLGEIVRPWLEKHPRGRVALLDYAGQQRTPELLSPFSGLDADFSREGQVTLRAALNPRAREGMKDRAPVWVPEKGAFRETRVEDGRAEIVLPLPDSGDVSGAFTWNGPQARDYAESLFAVTYRIPPPATLCVLAPRSGWMARATLGEGGKRLKVRALLSAAELGAGDCNLLYLSDPENPDASMLARAAAVLRTGGKVIVGTGRHTDAALLNRNLLIPLGTGRLTLESHGSLAAQARPDALAKLGLRAAGWGRVGAVRTHLGFAPGAETRVLLSAKRNGREIPLLLHQRAGGAGGELLLWTTDIGDPEWSDIGLGPWAALMHQAFLGASNRGWAGGPASRALDSDSAGFFPGDEAAGDAPVVRDPQGSAAPWRPEPGGGRAGPFDRTGLHRLEYPGDSARPGLGFAVRLASGRLGPDPRGDKEPWDRFYAALGESAAARAARVSEPDQWRSLYGGFNLRLSLLILAALLLFAEGVVSLRLSPFRN